MELNTVVVWNQLGPHTDTSLYVKTDGQNLRAQHFEKMVQPDLIRDNFKKLHKQNI